MSSFDVAVVGGGLIGAAIACHIAPHRRTVLIEQESQPGYHASGRSAAILVPSYGGPLAQALTAASIEFLKNPPSSFAASSLISPRGAVFFADEAQLPSLGRWTRHVTSQLPHFRMLTAQQSVQLVPILRAEKIAAAVWLPEICDIDASALLQVFIRSLRAQGGSILLNSRVTALERHSGRWRIETSTDLHHANIIVNAAGAWADGIADLACVPRLGLTCYRRTLVAVDAPPTDDVRNWPLVCDAAETLYFKPDGSRLLLCPADQTPLPPQDVQADEFDVAVAVDRFEAVTSWTVKRVTHRWAGLRTMVPDKEPVLGFDLATPDFLWAAGFGGFGVQAAFAAGRCAETLLTHGPLPADLSECGVDFEQLSPARLVRSCGSDDPAKRGCPSP